MLILDISQVGSDFFFVRQSHDKGQSPFLDFLPSIVEDTVCRV